jgi:hypothetical protein
LVWKQTIWQPCFVVDLEKCTKFFAKAFQVSRK